MAAKKVKVQFALHMTAGKATPAPPVWPILWAQWVNIWTFIKEFNDTTRELMTKYGDVKVPCKITVYIDRSYSMEILPPVTSHLLLWKAKQKQWAGEPNKTKIAKLNRKDLLDIVEIKKSVMNTKRVESALKIIAWTAKNMWIEVDLS